MADTSVDGAIHGSVDFNDALWGPYWSDISVGVIIGQDTQQDLSMYRTTDKGATWTATEIQAGTLETLCAWYDKETPGDTGTLLHIVWADSTLDDILYVNVDVSDGTVGTIRTVATPAVVDTNGSKNRLCITKSRNGNLYIGYSLVTGTTEDFLRSTDLFATAGTSRAALFESALDWAMLFPADTGDGADVAALFWDSDVDDLTVQMYDDSSGGSGAWTETDIDTAAIDDIVHRNLDGVIRHSDGHLLVAFHSDDDATTDDLRTFDLTVDSIASPTITAKTVIFTDQAESAQIAIWINQQDDEVRVAHLKGGTWLDETNIVFHISTDGMGIWGSEQAYSEGTIDDNRLISAGRMVGDDGGRYQPSWYDDDKTELFVNEVNDVEIAAAVLAGAGPPVSAQVI